MSPELYTAHVAEIESQNLASLSSPKDSDLIRFRFAAESRRIVPVDGSTPYIDFNFFSYGAGEPECYYTVHASSGLCIGSGVFNARDIPRTLPALPVIGELPVPNAWRSAGRAFYAVWCAANGREPEWRDTSPLSRMERCRDGQIPADIEEFLSKAKALRESAQVGSIPAWRQKSLS